jgi:hypothetical protein
VTDRAIALAPAPDVLVRHTPMSVVLCTDAVAEPMVLRDTARTIWSAFADGASTEAVAADLARDFQLELAEAEQALAPVVAELRAAGALAPVR